MAKKLKEITLEEIEQKIHDHQLWLKGDSDDKRADFSGYDLNGLADKVYNISDKDGSISKNRKIYDIFINESLSGAIFEGLDLSNFSFFNTNLSQANFKNTTLEWCEFFSERTRSKDAILQLTDFRDASYKWDQFNDQQISDAIFTEPEYKEKVTKKLKEQEKKIEEQDIVIENTNEEQTDLLIDGFKEIKDDFELEERRWLIISMFSFIVLITLTIISIIDYISPGNTIKYLMYLLISSVAFLLLILYAISDNKEKTNKIPFISWPTWKNLFLTIGKSLLGGYIFVGLISLNIYINSVNTKKESLFNFENPYYIFIPFSLGLFSFIYFSICQYSKAKELRIENQNKIALLHGFQSINSNELITNKEIFHQNIADVVFTKAYMNKNSQNLPIDKVIDLIKISQK